MGVQKFAGCVTIPLWCRSLGSELAQIRDYSIKGRLVSRELAARQVLYPLADFASSKKWQNQETESDRTAKLQANKYVSPAAGFGHHGIG